MSILIDSLLVEHWRTARQKSYVTLIHRCANELTAMFHGERSVSHLVARTFVLEILAATGALLRDETGEVSEQHRQTIAEIQVLATQIREIIESGWPENQQI